MAIGSSAGGAVDIVTRLISGGTCQSAEGDFCNASPIYVTWRRDRVWYDVALAAQDGRMGRPRCEVLRVCTHTSRRSVSISAQIWRWRAGCRILTVAAVAGVAIVHLDGSIYVQTRVLDGSVGVDHSPVAVRTLRQLNVRRWRRQAVATSAGCNWVTRGLPLPSNRAVTISAAAGDRVSVVGRLALVGLRQCAKNYLSTSVTVDVTWTINIGGYLVTLATSNGAMGRTVVQVIRVSPDTPR